MDGDLKLIVWLAALVVGVILSLAGMETVTTHRENMACLQAGGSPIKGMCVYITEATQ